RVVWRNFSFGEVSLEHQSCSHSRRCFGGLRLERLSIQCRLHRCHPFLPLTGPSLGGTLLFYSPARHGEKLHPYFDSRRRPKQIASHRSCPQKICATNPFAIQFPETAKRMPCHWRASHCAASQQVAAPQKLIAKHLLRARFFV